MEAVAVRDQMTTERPQRKVDLTMERPPLVKWNRDENNRNQVNCGWNVQARSRRSRYVQRIGGSARGLRPEMAAPSDNLRGRRKALAKKEIVRRALAPPPRRPSLRWLDFRPTPSRLCNMSMA